MTETALVALSGLTLFIWLWLALFRGGFWRADQRLGGDAAPDHWPDVVAVIPARNEAPTIGATVRSLLGQNYPGTLSVIVVDDSSTDGTAAAAGHHKNLHVLQGLPLEAGWTGKLWAVNQGLEAIKRIAPAADYVLLTDGDIEHHPDNLRQLVSKATGGDRHLVSLMVALRCKSFWEKRLIPAFVFFFQKLYPFPQVNIPSHPMAAAAGGCMLVRLQTLRKAGGLAPLKSRLIDDCALAAHIKPHGAIWLGLSEGTRSLRAYDGLSDIWHMVARTAFVQLDHSFFNLVGTVVAMCILYLAPPLLVVIGIATGQPALWMTAAAAYLTLSLLYVPTLRLYQRPLIEALTLPLAGALYSLMTVSSALRHWRGQGGNWKGRSYPGASSF